MSGAVKTIVSFGGHGYSTGAAYPPLIERDLNLQVESCIEAALERKYTGFRHLRPKLSNNPVRWPLADRTKFARDNQADLFAEIHFNAGGGTRTVMYVHTNATEQDLQLARICHDKLVPFMATLGVRDGGIQKANFMVLRETPGIPSVLPEICFLDHPTDRAAVMSPAFFGLVGELLADGFAEFLGLSVKSNQQPFRFSKYHQVVGGDNNWSVARKYDLTVSELASYNSHIPDMSIIYKEYGGDILWLEPPSELEMKHGALIREMILLKKDDIPALLNEARLSREATEQAQKALVDQQEKRNVAVGYIEKGLGYLK